MRALFLLIISAAFLSAASETPAAKLWNDLKAKREALAGLHQEFEVSRTLKFKQDTQSSKWQMSIDMSGGRWREKSIRGSGNDIRIFDGAELYVVEEGGDEFLHAKRHPKDPASLPAPFFPNEADWTKARELQRTSCGLRDRADQCVVFEVRLKPWILGNINMANGSARISVDLENGLILALSLAEAIQAPRTAYESDFLYTATRFTYGAPTTPSLFELPANLHEVKEFTRWTPERIRNELAAKPAPELNVVDIDGHTVSLSSFKGKTVLLDFWTTWCPPCRADAPALDKLYKKYSAQDLMIVGISVNEDRSVVEKFLKDHPHSFPVVLTTENEMPRAYQIGAFPTYIVIDRNGAIASAVDGDQGFSDLRKLLKKAGLEVD